MLYVLQVFVPFRQHSLMIYVVRNYLEISTRKYNQQCSFGLSLADVNTTDHYYY